MADIRKTVLDCLSTEPDKYARQVLQRIAVSRDAQAALNAISKDEKQISWLIQHCISAETLMRKFSELLVAQGNTKERLQRHRKSVSDLRQFIKQATRWRETPMIMPLSETETERLERQQRIFKHSEAPDAYEKTAGYYRDALNRIELLIEKRQELIEDTILLLGVTRKSKTKTAAENSAIGFLANRVANLMGKPHARHVAALAEAALGISEVTEDRVREAAKMRRKKLVYSTNK